MYSRAYVFTLSPHGDRRLVGEIRTSNLMGVGCLQFSLSRTRPIEKPALPTIESLLRLSKATENLLLKHQLTNSELALRESSIDNLLTASSAFGLSNEQALQRIHTMNSILLEWEYYFSKCGVSAGDLKLLNVLL